MRFRQIHLDFHTSEAIPDIGRDFSKKQFQEMLKLGHVDSITVFSKCHHGWAYHPTEANEMHPGLKFDLLGEMIEAAHEIGVKTPVYISAGLDEKLARRQPNWLIRDRNERTNWAPDFMEPGYHQFCMNTPYLEEVLLPQVKEVVERYEADGIFMDIVGVRECYCQYCVSAIRERGGDPRDLSAMSVLWEETYHRYATRVNETVQSIKPELPVFHNGGHIRRGRRDLASLNPKHLELESLPTGGWGYDHFPLSARYVQGLGMKFLGMTGKFHTTWGEFGGFKHPNALRYEAALSIANGARCSIGDQLHPYGLMDEATYALIGSAYSEVEAKEAWCRETRNVADVALLSLEGCGLEGAGEGQSGRTGDTDAGAVRMLLEGKVLFDVVDLETDFSGYKVVILPDRVSVDSKLQRKLEEYLRAGGKLLATGESGLLADGSGFAIDLGVRWEGANEFSPAYVRPHFDPGPWRKTSFVLYSDGQRVELSESGEELAAMEVSFFNRDIFTFCSHQHTPSTLERAGVGMAEGADGIYIAWNVFGEYASKGSLILRELVMHALGRLLPDRTLSTNLGAQGIVTLQHQPEKGRYVQHLLYASPVKRGDGIEVIEEILPQRNTEVRLRVDAEISKVYLAPQMQEIPFRTADGYLTYTVPEWECHQMVVLDVLK